MILRYESIKFSVGDYPEFLQPIVVILTKNKYIKENNNSKVI